MAQMLQRERDEGSVGAQLEEIRDMELVNRLDIINIKNEIDKLKLTLPQSIEQIPRDELMELVKIAEKVKDIKALKQSLDEIEQLKERLKDHPEEIRRLQGEIQEMKHQHNFFVGREAAGCSACGAELPAVAKFCKKCGKRVKHAEE